MRTATILAVILISFTLLNASRFVARAGSADGIPDLAGLTTQVRQANPALVAERADLTSAISEFNGRVRQFNSDCAAVDTDDAKAVQSCRDRQAGLETEKRDLVARIGVFNADARSVRANLTQAKQADSAYVRLRIAGIQNALRQLNKAMSLDASQRQEWEDESAHASFGAWVMAGSLALDGLSHATDNAIALTDEDINEAVRLHQKVKPLRARKASLEQLRTQVGSAKKAYDYSASVETVQTSLLSGPTGEAALEGMWSRGEDAGLVPPLGHWAKSAADASYLTAVQAASVLSIRQLDSNQDRYLAAVNALKARMEALVNLSK